MSAREAYRKVFGQIDTLEHEVSWSTGVSNMLEWLTWSTNDVLGITKTRYRNLIVELSHEESVRNASLEEKQAHVAKRMDQLIKESERTDRYSRPASSVASPREALRRAKYFSEDYLNKEFDIFWSLVSSRYLDEFYGQFIDIEKGGYWYSHGNSGLFAASTNISEMQMDNLSFNATKKVLIANELKLGGKKNKDQIVKYALMYKLLQERGFIPSGTRFVLLFIGDRAETPDWQDLIDQEIDYCAASKKSTLKLAAAADCIAIARDSEYASTTWSQLHRFNDSYGSSLSKTGNEVERKLLRGFNETLSAKAFFARGGEEMSTPA